MARCLRKWNLHVDSKQSHINDAGLSQGGAVPRTHRLQRVMITAGGTGGHIFPGLAVAQILMHKGASVRWVGTDYGLEKDLVPKANIPLHFLPIRGLRGKGIKRYLTMPFMLASSLWQAWRLIRKTQPQLVLSLGGYASGPLALAARFAGIPLVIHEQNAAPGLTNRLLAPFASLVLAGLPNPLQKYPQYREVGNPVRSTFVDLHQARLAESDEVSAKKDVRVLVVGGSQGAQKLNQAVPKAMTRIREAHPDIDIRIVHQAGPANVEQTQELYAQTNHRVDVVDFIDDMAGAYGWADIVIGRAGALTVAEVAAAGVACVFVPLAIAVDDHQTKNAMTLVDQGAAAIVAEPDLLTDVFFSVLERLVSDAGSRDEMAQTALSAAKTDAAQKIYGLMECLVNPEVLSS